MWPTLLGWCETSIVYNDSTTGPQCAGRPPGGRECKLDLCNHPFYFVSFHCIFIHFISFQLLHCCVVCSSVGVCPSSFQNSYCPAYLCSKQNYQCQPTNKTDGIVLLLLFASWFLCEFSFLLFFSFCSCLLVVFFSFFYSALFSVVLTSRPAVQGLFCAVFGPGVCVQPDRCQVLRSAPGHGCLTACMLLHIVLFDFVVHICFLL
jgi:hypothetical protein